MIDISLLWRHVRSNRTILRLLLRLHQPKAKSASITIFESPIKSSRFLGVFIRVCLSHGVLPFYDTNGGNHDTPWYTMKFRWFSPHFSSRTMALSSRNPSGIQTWQLKNPTFIYRCVFHFFSPYTTRYHPHLWGIVHGHIWFPEGPTGQASRSAALLPPPGAAARVCPDDHGWLWPRDHGTLV